MQAAGAILIAITNVPEVCSWVETSNGIYGQTKNPYDTRRTVGGSSGGEGALISAAGSVIGIGSDLAGSIRIPSFMNGIFAMITTPGVIPLDGDVPPAKGYPKKMLRIGPMCRYVEDIPVMIEVMGGDKVPELRLSDAVDFSKTRIYYMEGIQIPTIQSLSCDMKSALLQVMGTLSTLIYAISRIYFLVITTIFGLVNHFKNRRRVPATNDPLLLLSATEAVRKIAKREITSQQLVAAYVHRIEQVNGLINAVVIKLFDEATRKAEEIDNSIAGMDDYQLEEINLLPDSHNEWFDSNHFGFPPSLNLLLWLLPFKPLFFLKITTLRMQAAGAILIAITNVPEVCYWVETSNGIYGQTKNPYDTRRTVGGSSGGEGALISAAGSVIGIGSDIGGSIRIPSFMNGIFGMKNTPGIFYEFIVLILLLSLFVYLLCLPHEGMQTFTSR
ncbi:hypothetical protein GCK32_012907 [Trichostrongylus colubriformis]|uniref:Amidase domain-containing protein n=1 Tax=Trichostrongylus colubriformis TaxID=6319 RepID=A0AAN8F5K0_TRICO